MVTYFDEAVVVEEVEHAGSGGGVVPEARGGDFGDDLVDGGARLREEVQRQPVPLRRAPGAGLARHRRHGQRLRLPGARRADGRRDEQQEQDATADEKSDASGGTHYLLIIALDGEERGAWKEARRGSEQLAGLSRTSR
jgi:hypothetical protein